MKKGTTRGETAPQRRTNDDVGRIRSPAEGRPRLEVTAGEPPALLFQRILAAYLAGPRTIEVVETPELSGPTRNVLREFCRKTGRTEIRYADGSVAALVEIEGRLDTGELDDRVKALGARVVAFHRQVVESWDLPSPPPDWSADASAIEQESWRIARSSLVEGIDEAGREHAAWLRATARAHGKITAEAIVLADLGPWLAGIGGRLGLLRQFRQFHGQAMDYLDALRQSDPPRAVDLWDVGEALVVSGRALGERVLPAVADGSLLPSSAAAFSRALEATRTVIGYGQEMAERLLDPGFPQGVVRA